MSYFEPQQQPGEPFAVSLSPGGVPAFALSPTKQLAFGLHYGSLSPDAAAQLLTQQKADPNGQYHDGRCDCRASLLHLAAEKCVGEDGAAILTSLIDAGASVNYTSYSPEGAPWALPCSKKPLDSLLDRLRHADSAQLSALLPMIETLLRHGARCYYPGGALSSVFTSSAMKDISATQCLEVVTRLTTAAAAAPRPPGLYGETALNEACQCQFRGEEDQQAEDQQADEQPGDAAHDGHTEPHIAILEKIVEGTGWEVLEGWGEGERGSYALSRAVESQNRAVVYWLVRQRVKAVHSTLILAHEDTEVMSFLVREAGADVDDDGAAMTGARFWPPLVEFVREGHYTAAEHLNHLGASVDRALTHFRTTARQKRRILSVYHDYLSRSVPTHAMHFINTEIAAYLDPLAPLPFSARTPLGRRLNAALRFFVSRVCNVASPSVRRRLFRHTAFVTPHITHTDTSDSQGGGEGGQVDEGIVYGLRDVIHLIRCEEAQRYELPDIDSGFGRSKPFECAFDSRVVVRGAGGGQCVVEVIDAWEGMDQRGPPGALWGEESSDDDDGLGDYDLDEENDIDEDGMDEDGLEDGAGDGIDEGFMDDDGMNGDQGEDDDDMIDDDEQQQQHVEADQAADEMDGGHSSGDLNPPIYLVLQHLSQPACCRKDV
ncbi:unnamed protein product [Vitrella brassicaformis CCMP3155]|uniref:Uncharacterized protein n=2 Tax=Vitrella brassicaformis TaxID=1169539 RepID=A0A0G4GEN3_VITBC|nr:unnamed protein product [Vitrella brassicaformis CCMP3155]|eukprot:CEM27820.1 unnamed protein product [Vitrella brassicaformis CCMP3155]